MSEAPTFTVAADGKSITCLRCSMTSHNANDIRQLYCGNCQQFHDLPASLEPHFWQYEASGQLRPVVEAYLLSKSLSAEEIAILRAYCRQWIFSPVWDRNPVVDVIGMAHLADLRRQIDEMKTSDDVDQWIVEATEYGFDPL